MSAQTQDDLGLVADIGGTNCRFAFCQMGGGALETPAQIPCASHSDFKHAMRAYLETEAKGRKPNWAVIAVAGPVDQDVVTLTNRNWRIAGPEISAEFGLRKTRVVNDFTALSRSVPLLGDEHRIKVGGTEPHIENGVSVMGVLGAGTGLGVGGLVSSPHGVIPLATEGGHSTFAPCDDFELEIDKTLRAKFERISNERLLSGEGLVNLHWAISTINGVAPVDLKPREVTERARAKSDPISMQALEVFSRVMGSFAGDLALIYGARGGIYIAGGLAPATLDVFDRAQFRARFEAKGRFRKYMEDIPAWIVTHPYAGLVGAAALSETLAS